MNIKSQLALKADGLWLYLAVNGGHVSLNLDRVHSAQLFCAAYRKQFGEAHRLFELSPEKLQPWHPGDFARLPDVGAVEILSLRQPFAGLGQVAVYRAGHSGEYGACDARELLPLPDPVDDLIDEACDNADIDRTTEIADVIRGMIAAGWQKPDA